MTEKLQKVLADKGIGSRRKVEEMIECGRIQVNGKIAHIGQRIELFDRVQVDGKQVSLGSNSPELLLYHKPAGQICSHGDPEGRPTVFDDLPKLSQGRWLSIGRLDYNTQGLLLLTNTGELANKWMHPRSNIDREYKLRVRGRLTDDKLNRLKTGVMLEDGMARCKKITLISSDKGQQNYWLSIVLTEGRNREVRRMMEAVDCTVSQLKRTRFGHLSLPKTLPAGEFLRVPAAEHQPR